ncbi:hypothetical protein DPMN_039218 [Dreissena polymorpha]|uniref:Uncharacterized protein n=1 Tax=Dreissena polymorpha TaxID=45954 RepID=A0A9D4RPD2_DREPO|nr:hypothetical protein DPMN_039218 [Dreissena polymorpha]
MDGFQIHFSQNNADTLTIGGCSSFRICYLMNATLKEKYSLAATSDGGLLKMRNIGNNHYGTYTCTGAFDNTNPRSILVLRRNNMVINGYGADETIVSVWKLLTIILIVNI